MYTIFDIYTSIKKEVNMKLCFLIIVIFKSFIKYISAQASILFQEIPLLMQVHSINSE